MKGFSVLELFLAAAILSLAGTVALPHSRPHPTPPTKADLEECRRTSESALRRMYCSERLARGDGRVAQR